MVNALFYSSRQTYYPDICRRMDASKYQYWTTDSLDRFYILLAKYKFDFLFYDFQDSFPSADAVKDHLQQSFTTAPVFFFNQPRKSDIDMLTGWLDIISCEYRKFNTSDVDKFLYTVSGVEYKQLWNAVSLYNLPHHLESNLSGRTSFLFDVPVEYSEKIEDIQSEEKNNQCERNPGIQEKSPTPAVNDDNEDDAQGSFFCDHQIVPGNNAESLIQIIAAKEKYHLSFHECVLLDLLYQRKNQLVSIDEMMDVLWEESNEKHKKTIYFYMHNIRKILEQHFAGKGTVARVKKNYYSLLFF